MGQNVIYSVFKNEGKLLFSKWVEQGVVFKECKDVKVCKVLVFMGG